MLRVDLNLEVYDDLQSATAQWRFAPGFVPGETNEGLVAGVSSSPARLAEYDDSEWEICKSIQDGRSSGFTFGWFRITFTVPEFVQGKNIKNSRMFFETCIDDYGEIWVDGKCDLSTGTVAGFNIPQRVTISTEVQPGEKHTIACLAANGPLAAPGGGIFMRYARLGFENYSLNW